MKIIQEHKLQRWSSIVPLMLPDGWCPLAVRVDEQYPDLYVVLSVIVDPSKPAESETLYMLSQGDAMPEVPDGKELAFLGACQNGRHLFLLVEAAQLPGTRFIGRY